MKRTYLEEDIQLIAKYFPGARPVALRTPFDLTRGVPDPVRLEPSGFRDTETSNRGWTGGVLWMN